MRFREDESGQGALEYILLFGAVIIIAVVSIIIYNNYSDSSINTSNHSDEFMNNTQYMNT
ncbi:MAG: Flp family type IVb pilin [Methanobacterium sp.]|jgi:uncharacterized protein (UPF0333 family)